MKIACLGWGSLIRDPGDLPLASLWFKDGPLLPIEFARRSDNDRITLVIVPDDPTIACVRSLWALMALGELESAKQTLADRETRRKVKPQDIPRFVGFWSEAGTSGQDYADGIGEWAFEKGLDAVVWTTLPPRFENKPGQKPTADQVISFLKDLKERSYEKWKGAEEYIREAPRQIDTEYRRRIETEFGWSPITKI